MGEQSNMKEEIDYIVYFEPMCINAESPQDVEKIYNYIDHKPDILKIVRNDLGKKINQHKSTL